MDPRVQTTLATADGTTESCVYSETFQSQTITFNEEYTLFSAIVTNVQSDNIKVQIVHNERNSVSVCDTIEKMVYMFYEYEQGCNRMKNCQKIYECTKNYLCEYACECPGNSDTCGIKLIAVPEVQNLEWSICGIYV